MLAGGLCLGAAPGPLTEADVVRLAAARSGVLGSAEALEAAARAVEVGVTRYPNPSLGWNRQHIPGSGPEAEAEDGITISVPIDLSGRRASRGALARARAERLGAQTHRVRSRAVLAALQIYYRAVFDARRVRIATARLERLSEAARVVSRRRAEGAASGYDEARIRLEVELAQSALATLRTSAAAARAEVAARLALPGPVELQADLRVRTSTGAASERPSMARARAAVDEAGAAADAADRAWIPALSLTGGLFIRDGGEAAYGYVAGLSFGLPIFTRGQGLKAQARAQRRVAEAQVETIAQRTRVAVSRAGIELEGALAEARRFDRAIAGDLERLERAALGGYREGHSSIIELVDAQRMQNEVEVRRLTLAFAAKSAALRLRAARGEFE